MPAELIKITFPVAVNRPYICEAPCAGLILFRAIPFVGCWKWVFSPALILKLCQLIIALLLVWLITVDLGYCWILAWPAVIWPPWGLANEIVEKVEEKQKNRTNSLLLLIIFFKWTMNFISPSGYLILLIKLLFWTPWLTIVDILRFARKIQ